MTLLDIILHNLRYNEKYPDKYPKRPIEFTKHFRVLGKHNNKFKLYSNTIDVQKFFIETANISNDNTYILYLPDLLSTYDETNIIWIDGKKLSNIINLAGKNALKIDDSKLFFTTTELMFDIDGIGQSLSDYMISKNIIITEKAKIEALIDDFFNGSDNEFYIVMNPVLDEYTKYESSGKILIPDDNTIYSFTDVDFIMKKILEYKLTPVVIPPTPKNVIYTGFPQEIINEGSTSLGVFQYSLDGENWSTVIPKLTNSGEYEIYYRVKGNQRVHNTAVQSVIASILKSTPEVTKPTARSLIYNGQPQQLLNEGYTNLGVLEYSLDYVNWSTSIPTGNDAGEYDVYYKVEGNDNINSVISREFIEVFILKVTPTVTSAIPKELTYNTNSQELIFPAVSNFGTVKYNLNDGEWSTLIPSAINGGEYVVGFKVEGNNNINDIQPQYVHCIIYEKVVQSPLITLSPSSFVYNTHQHKPVVEIKDESVIVNPLEYIVSYDNNINAGNNTASVIISDKSGGNYNISGIKTFTIDKVTPTVTAPTAKSLTYNGQPQELINAGSTNWGTIKYSLDNTNWSTSIPTGTNVGNYTVYYKVDGDSNINDVSANSINARINIVTPNVVAPTPKSLTYNRTQQQLINTGSTNFGTMKYNVDGGEWSTSIPVKTNGGTYTVGYKVDGDSNVMSIEPQYIICSINEKEITATIELSETEYVYNGQPHTPTVVVKDDDIIIDPSEYTVSYSNNINAGIGTAVAMISDNTGGNYRIICTESFTINKVTPTVTAPVPNTLIYDRTPQILVEEALTNWGTIKYSLNGTDWSTSRPTGTDAGNYTVYYKVEGNENINDVLLDVVYVTINKVTPTVTAPTPNTLVYDNTSKVLINEGHTNYGTMEYSLDRVNWSESLPQAIEANTYAVYYKVEGDSNINNVEYNSVNVTISKVTPNTVAPTPNELTYNNTYQNLVNAGSTNWGTMKYSLDNINWSDIIPVGNNAGNYTVYYKVDGDSNINNVTVNSVSVTISKITPTVIPPTINTLTYNETLQTLTDTTGSTNFGTLKYNLNGGEWSTTLPSATNAGTYVIGYKVDGDSNLNNVAPQYINCTINEKTVSSPTITLSQSVYTYNNQQHTPTVVVKDGNTTIDPSEYTVSYISNINAGNNTAIVKITDNANGNYNISGIKTFTIDKVTPTVTAPTAKSLTYNSTSQQLINAGSTNWGTIKYSLDNINWSTSIPEGTQSKTYTVYYEVDGDDNINNVAANSINVTIDKVTPTYTAPTAKSLTYNGQAQELINAGSTNWGVMLYSLDNTNWDIFIPTCINAGSYTVYYKVEGNTNINDIPAASISITINKVTPTVTAPEANTLIFNESSQQLINAGSTDWGTLKYNLDGGEWSISIPTAINMGSYVVGYKVDGNSNINDIEAQYINCSISAKTVTPSITLSQDTYTYNNNACEPNVTIKDGDTIIDPSEYIVSYSNNVNVGTATVTITDNNGGNYIVSGSTQFTINKVTPTITAPTANTLTYDGTAQALITAGSTNWGTIQYSLDDTNWSTSIPTATNADTYTVYYKVVGDSNIVDVASNSISVEISKVTPTISNISANTLTYNGTAQELITEGSSDYGTLQYSLDEITWNTSVPTAINADTYIVYYKVEGDSNINNTSIKSKSVIISKVTPTVIAPTANALTYDGTAQPLITAGSTNFGLLKYNLDGGTWGTAIPSETVVGLYTVGYKIEGDSNINDVAPQYINCIINGNTVQITVELSQQSYTYDGLSHQPSVTVKDGENIVDPSEYSVSYSNNVNAGTATVTITIINSSTYDDMIISKSFEIVKVTPTVTAPTANTLTYDGTAQELIIAGSTNWGTIQYSLDDTNWSTSIPTATNADTYTVYYKVVGDSNVNDVASNTVNVTIDKLTPTVTAPTANTLTYDGTAQELIIAGSTNWGTLKYSLDNTNWNTSIPTATNADTYIVYYKVEGNSNVNDVVAQSINCNIDSKTITPTILLSESSHTYSGNNNEPSVTVKDNNTIIDPSEYTVSYSNNVNVGTATVTITDNNGGNYIVSGSTQFTINKVTPTVTAPTANMLTYDGTAQALITAGSTNYGTIQYSLDDTNWSTSIPTATNADTYTVYYKVVGDSNVNDVASNTVSVTIDKLTPTVTAPTANTLTYDGTAQALITAGLTNYGTMQYSLDDTNWSTSIPTAINADTYTVYYKVVGDSNIADVASNTVSVTIDKLTPTLTAPTANTLTYDGTDQALITAGSTNYGTMQYSLDDTNWSTSIPTAINADTYTAYYKVVGDSNIADVTSNSVSVIIDKLTPTVTAPTPNTLTYDGTAQALITAGSTNYGTIQYSLDDTNWSTSIPTATNADTYTVYYKVVGDSNVNNVASQYITCTINSIDYLTKYFTIESLQDNNAITMVKTNSCAVNPELYYSVDNGQNWSSVTASSNTNNITTINTGDKLIIKSTNNKLATAWDIYNRFNGSKQFKVYGNPMSLLYGDNFVNNSEFATGSTHNLCGLFYGTTTLIDASDLVLPASIGTTSCYNGMFRGCTNLAHGPKELPATSINGDSYSSMFEGCINLEEAPIIWATSMSGDTCMQRMFCMDRNNKITTPKLTKGPILRPSRLTTNSYKEMFKGNGNLVEVTCLATSGLGNTANWLTNCSSTGTFYKSPSATWSQTGTSNVPTGWTIEDYVENE